MESPISRYYLLDVAFSCVTNPEHALYVLRQSLADLLIQSKETTAEQQENPKRIMCRGTAGIKVQHAVLIYRVFKRNVFSLKLYIC